MRIKPIKVLLAVLFAIILLCACAKGDKASLEPPATVDVTSESLPTEASTEPTTEPTQPTTEPSSEQTTQPTTEATTQPTTEAVTTKPVEKTTKKTTKKTTVKTEKTKSTTTKKAETSQTTTEDVPLPEPEAIAERPEKLSQELRDRVASAQPDELIGIIIDIVRPTDEEIDARVLAEYGLSYPYSEPDTIPVIEPSPDGGFSPPVVPEEMKYFDAFDEVMRSEYISRIEAFLDGYVPEERKAVWYTANPSSITLDATVEEILLYTAAPQVEMIYLHEPTFDDVSDPENAVEVSDPEPAVEVGEPESSVEEE